MGPFHILFADSNQHGREHINAARNCQTGYRRLPMRYNFLCLLLLLSLLVPACTKSTSTTPAVTGTATTASSGDEQNLEQRLKTISDRAQGNVGLSVIHIESGKAISINGKSQLPLYSVFKLPLAVAILKEVEENRLRLDQKILVTPEDIVPGTPGNTALWVNPGEHTIEALIDFSIARSDNTSTEKLLQLAGGPAKVTERMRSLGFQNLDIHSTIGEYVKTRQNPNTGVGG